MLHSSLLLTGLPLACSRVSKPVSHPFTPAEVCSHLTLNSNKYFSYIPSFNKSCKFFRVPPSLIFFATYSGEISQLVLWGCNCRSSEVCVVANRTDSLQCRLGLVMLLMDQDMQAGFQQHLHFSITFFAKEKGEFLRECCGTQTPSHCQPVLPLKRLHKDHADSPVWCEGNCCCYLK